MLVSITDQYEPRVANADSIFHSGDSPGEGIHGVKCGVSLCNGGTSGPPGVLQVRF